MTGLERFRTFRRGNLGPSLPHCDNHSVQPDDFDPIAAVPLRAYRRQGSLYIDVRIAAPQFAVGEDPSFELQAEGSMAQVGQSDGGEFVQAQKVGVIQLDFGTGGRSGSQNVGFYQRHVDRGLDRISRFASLHGNVTLGQAEPGDTQRRTGLLRLCRRRVIEGHGNEGKQRQYSASSCHG